MGGVHQTDGLRLHSLYQGSEVSAEILPACFLTVDPYKSWLEGRLSQKILSVDLNVLRSLFLYCLVADPNRGETG